MSLENEALRDQLQAERAGIENERARIREQWGAVEGFKSTRRYRFARVVGRAGDLLRRAGR
jgi:hypothetical protein